MFFSAIRNAVKLGIKLMDDELTNNVIWQDYLLAQSAGDIQVSQPFWVQEIFRLVNISRVPEIFRLVNIYRVQEIFRLVNISGFRRYSG